ncbi:MAG: ABC transporter ATP-binding protein/permease [Ruminococcaceae bacterium]|nr:ABC transporter ATP-binding protein/permease [Oscillospiraceae bacterium]
MLELKNITKNYSAGTTEVKALKGISLRFRKSDFVSILGPSGCGKTTMLNIIGGLDQYTDGDLIINSKSTKDYKDRDWDTYRNHSIGFVFQSYNLIPHQSVLQNVELALTLSGVSKKERRQRAVAALERVGLGDQLKKRPSEMSGGQMQRVAIARALVNNPDIILADEPTGALDTETSVQVMEILKEISKDRLVIMVTHNPELADKYSTRIIRMIDGVITSDSAPLTEEEAEGYRKEDLRALEEQKAKKKKEKKPSMSFATAFGLSLKNLFTKKGRTALTSFAGSIGIIGIALIFALSNGATTYINTVQEDTLSAYPLTLEATTVDMGTLMQTFMGIDPETEENEDGKVYSQSVMIDMLNALNNMETTENDLKAFKAYLEDHIESDSDLDIALNGVQYSYDLDLLVYTKDVDGKIIRSDSEELMMEAISKYMGMDMAGMMSSTNGTAFGSMMQAESSMMAGNVWTEILSSKDGKLVSPVVEGQYEVIYGSWPNEYNEIVLVVNENNEIDDMTLYALGLNSEEEVKEAFDAVLKGTEITTEKKSWTYEEICDMDFRVILNSSCYTLDEATGLYTDMRETEAGLQLLWADGFDLKVSGIIRKNEDATSAMITGSIGYTKALTEYVIKESSKAASVEAQKNDPGTDIFTGLPFSENTGSLSDSEKKAEFLAYVNSLSDDKKAELYKVMASLPTEEEVSAIVEQSMAAVSVDEMKATLSQVMVQSTGMSESDVKASLEKMSEEDIAEYYTQIVTAQITMQLTEQKMQAMAGLDAQTLIVMLESTVDTLTDEAAALFYDEVLEFSESTYEKNLTALGAIDLESPAKINLFASTFENKDIIEEAISDYNKDVDEIRRIRYTDYVGIMMSSITTIINAITYVLIAFVAISLVVSSIMIGVITLISVQERTKEIGILRAIGASKKNVSSMFNAETVIIGFTSGLLGVVITALLCFPINAIIQALTGIGNIRAILPIGAAVILVAISVLLTLIAGIIPSRSAAKKDPVEALRTE